MHIKIRCVKLKCKTKNTHKKAMFCYVLWFYGSTSSGSMSKRHFAKRFHYTLKLQKYQWNMISKETLKTK